MSDQVKKNTIFRTPKTRDFTQVSNSIIFNKEISTDARFILTAMLTFKDDWDFCKIHLMDCVGLKKHTFNNAWNELLAKGYVKIHERPSQKGQFARPFFTIHEDPNGVEDLKESLANVDFHQRKDNLDLKKCLPRAENQLWPISTPEVSNMKSTVCQNKSTIERFTAYGKTATNNTKLKTRQKQQQDVVVSDQNLKELRGLSLTQQDINSLSTFDNERITLAITYARTAKVKKTMISLLIWHCQQSTPPVETIPAKTVNKGLAEKAYTEYTSTHYEIALDDDKINFISLYAQGAVISIKYDDEKFREEIYRNLTKRKFGKKRTARVS